MCWKRRIFPFLVMSLFLVPPGLSAQKTDTVSLYIDGYYTAYYLALVPADDSKGLIVILPGFATLPDTVLSETNMPAAACKAGYTVVIATLTNPFVDDKDNIFQKRLAKLIPSLVSRYKTPPGKFVIGGHSIGGLQAMYYAEMAYKQQSKIVRPALVFGVDPPLDLKRLYNGYMRSIRLNPAKAKGGEAEFITKRFNRLYGGPPNKRPAAYQAASAFYRDATDGGNLQYLASIPVRLYCDADVNWHVTERNNPLEYTNLADAVASIVQLRLLGNAHAELVTNPGKGYFTNGVRNPHAFNILDADGFIAWLNRYLQ
jgi:pimeloyl-ACP methyl ester carboxylesterase